MFEMPDHETIISERMFPNCGGNYLGTVVEPPKPKVYSKEPNAPVDFDAAVHMNALHYHWIQAEIATHAVRYTAITSDSTEMLQFRRLKDPATPDSPTLIDIYAFPPQGDKGARPGVVEEIVEGMKDKQNSLGIPDEVRFYLIPPDQVTLDL